VIGLRHAGTHSLEKTLTRRPYVWLWDAVSLERLCGRAFSYCSDTEQNSVVAALPLTEDVTLYCLDIAAWQRLLS